MARKELIGTLVGDYCEHETDSDYSDGWEWSVDVGRIGNYEDYVWLDEWLQEFKDKTIRLIVEILD